VARPRAWADVIFNVLIATGGVANPIDILFDLGSSRLATITVARLVGQMVMVPSVPGTAGLEALDWGVQVITEEAFTAGPAGIPNPGVTTEYPARGWLVLGREVVGSLVAGEDGLNPRWQFDIRTMRKIDKGRLALSMTSNNMQGATQTVRVIGRIRALCLT